MVDRQVKIRHHNYELRYYDFDYDYDCDCDEDEDEDEDDYVVGWGIIKAGVG